MYKKIPAAMRLLIFIFLVSFAASCTKQDNSNSSSEMNSAKEFKTPKYIFYFIGDGMAAPQVAMTQAYLRYTKNPNDGIGMEKLHFTEFPMTGLATTYAENRLITGSAAAGTALATGHKTTINTIAMNGDHTANLTSMAEMARDKGMKVGIVTSVSIDHATPAVFYAHEANRRDYYNIAAQMPASNFDYFGGGYALGDTLKDLQDKMTEAGYKIATTLEDMRSLKNGEKVWAYNHTVDSEAALYFEIDRPEDHISLPEFTQKGIELLDNENGFFMMVEGGKIDWACHANDAVAAANDVLAFDRSISKAIEFYKKHPDETLIVVTADHETGGLTLGYALTDYESAFEILKYQKISFEKLTEIVNKKLESDKSSFTLDEALKILSQYTGLGNSSLHEKLALSEYEMSLLRSAYHQMIEGKTDKYPEQEHIDDGGYNPFLMAANHILNRKAGLDWASYKHTALPVSVYAIGAGSENFTGYYDNTDIAKKIIKIGALKAK